MKIRSGFVSNSSSCSFLIYGIYLDDQKYDCETIIDFINELNNEDEKRFTYSEGGNYDDKYYVGISWDKIKDSETGLQFKTNIEQRLKLVFGEDVKCTTYSEAWYNG